MYLPTAPFIKAQQTWIDKRGLSKQVPMKLLCFGLPRTGTASLRCALWELGMEAYHGFAVVENPPDGTLWLQALRAKFEGQGRLFGKGEFDAIFSGCQSVRSCAVIDVPACIFVEELLAAYPEAKVMVTTRDVNSWYSSCMNTIIPSRQSLFMRVLLLIDSATAIYMPCLLASMTYYFRGDFPNNAKQVFQEHYTKVKRLAPPDQYLEYDVKEGWEPLCKFLEVDIPMDEGGHVKPFPKVNDSEFFNSKFRPFAKLESQKWLLALLALLVGLILMYGFARGVAW